MLAHLSFHNNAPLFARQTVEDTLGAEGFHRGEDYTLEVAAKEGLTFLDPLNVEEGRLAAKGRKDACRPSKQDGGKMYKTKPQGSA